METIIFQSIYCDGTWIVKSGKPVLFQVYLQNRLIQLQRPLSSDLFCPQNSNPVHSKHAIEFFTNIQIWK